MTFPVTPWPTPPSITPVPLPTPHGVPNVSAPRKFRYGGGAARFRARLFLAHTYTRQAPMDISPDPIVEAGETGPWGELIETFDPGTPNMEDASTSSMVPCLLANEERDILTPDGYVLVTWYTMYVRANDPISNGYQVSNVLDQKERVILPGPIIVLAATSYAPSGPTIYRVATMIQRRPGF